jgi:hypothetical protein
MRAERASRDRCGRRPDRTTCERLRHRPARSSFARGGAVARVAQSSIVWTDPGGHLGRVSPAQGAPRCRVHAIAEAMAQPGQTPPSRRGCRVNAPRARWITSKGGLRKPPSRLSRTGGPSRGRRARPLWRALSRAWRTFSGMALCDYLRPERARRRGADGRSLRLRERRPRGGTCTTVGPGCRSRQAAGWDQYPTRRKPSIGRSGALQVIGSPSSRFRRPSIR